MGEIVALNVYETNRPSPAGLEDKSSTPINDLCNEAVDTVRRLNASDDLSPEDASMGEGDVLQAADSRQHVLLARAMVLSQILTGRIAITEKEIAGKTRAYVALAGLPLEDPQLVHLLAVSLGRDGQLIAAGMGRNGSRDHQDANWSSQRNRSFGKLDEEE